jgi:site-specific DNA-methyltransferase (adenine-specific)
MGKKLFDYVIGNPPYQEDTDGAGRQAKPVYNLFVDEAKKITRKSISLITPSRWFSGGMGLDGFRNEMLNDRHLKGIVDYTNAKDIFPNTSISGGVNYFIWKSDYEGDCTFTNTTNGETTTLVRDLREFPVLVRYNQAVDIIHKVHNASSDNLASIASGLMPFGLSTSYRGRKQKSAKDSLTLYASNCVTYISPDEISKGTDYIGKWEVMVSKTGAEHAGEPSKDGTFRVIPSSMKVVGPNEVCTHSYFLIGCFDSKKPADNLYKYMRTRFVRFLMLMSMSGFGLSKLVMNFVPLQDFTDSSDINWNNDERKIEKQLYQKYGLSDDDISFIEANIKEMA